MSRLTHANMQQILTYSQSTASSGGKEITVEELGRAIRAARSDDGRVDRTEKERLDCHEKRMSAKAKRAYRTWSALWKKENARFESYMRRQEQFINAHTDEMERAKAAVQDKRTQERAQSEEALKRLRDQVRAKEVQLQAQNWTPWEG